MANDAYKDFYVQGLQALKSASDQGKGDTSATSDAITSPELKELMNASTKVMARQAEEIAQLIQKHGGDAGGMKNPFMEGIRAGASHMIQSAKDPAVRDASITAASQLAIHYYIAAYGTLASTAKHLGLDEDAKAFKRMTDEMKTGDERFTALAEGTVNKQAQSAG